jgi:DNA-binding MarR family transcriptional regulator
MPSPCVIIEALSAKHSVSVLLGLLDRGEVNKMRIMEFGPSINTIDAILDLLSSSKLIAIREEMRGRRVYYVSLTELGRRVAVKLDEIRSMDMGAV